MDNDKIIEILNSWNFWDKDMDTGIERNYYVNRIIEYLNDTEISIIVETGIRRSGKSYISKQVAKKLIKNNLNKKNILILNLDDERIFNEDYYFLLNAYKIYKEKINRDDKSIIIIDEAQEIDGWERFVRGLSERKEAKFIITGSSSKLLSSEFSTVLSGRHITVYINPLNYIEYLKFKNGNIESFLKNGGFPAVVLSNLKEELIYSYFNTVILKDISQRFNLKNNRDLINIAKFYLTSVGSRITFNSISRFMKMPVKTVYNFSTYLEESNLIFFVNRFSFSIKSRENSPKKVYSIDNSFVNAMGMNLNKINGRLLENAVASTLLFLSRNNTDFNFYYWFENNIEVDFVVKLRNKYKIINVSYIINESSREREIKSIIECSNHLNAGSGYIITFDYDYEEIINNVNIKYVSFNNWIKDIFNEFNINF